MNKYEIVYTVNKKQKVEGVEADYFNYFHDCGKLGVVFKNNNIHAKDNSIFYDVVKVKLIK